MDHDELHKVELPAIEQFKELGWTYLSGEALSPEHSAPERSSFRDVVLEPRLSAAIRRINPWISHENLHKVVRELVHLRSATLMEANRMLHETLVNYLSVEQDLGRGRRGQTVKIIDFDNPASNEFLAVNQFKVNGPNQNLIPDIILFVNGLPLAVIECKSNCITNPMEAGINQLLRYANQRDAEQEEGSERLFWYNQMMVSTCWDKARIGTISSRMEHYLEWKDPYPLAASDLGENPSSQEVLISGVFQPRNFLDLVRNFIVYEPMHGRIIKKLARYQQFRAVHKTIHRLRTAPTRKDKGGVIWHTQGSGKSLTMVFFIVKMRRDPQLRQYKLVFLTDRIQLDGQLTAIFQHAQGETVYHANSVARLKELLRKDSSDLVTGMIHKFQETEEGKVFEELNPSEKIVVLVDEGHRSQYGELGVNLNIALPNAPKIAFTGTPLIKTQKTVNEFGTYIDTYTYEQAVYDGATVQIIYEGREAQVKVTGDSLDNLFEAYFGDRSLEEQEAIKKKYGTMKAVLEAPQRIRWICIDILKHYREHIEPNGFKAMVVTSSRNAAVSYKEMFDELDGPQSQVIISGDHNDPERLRKYTDDAKQKRYIEAFLKPVHEETLSILCVKDMLLTGFDAPICQVMYLDRKIVDHNLLQAIARVNRTYEGKSRGFIVDYYGLSDYLTEALEMFSTEDVAGALKNLKDEIPKLEARHHRAMKYFRDIDHDDLDACALALKDDEVRAQFETHFKQFARSMDIVMPDPVAAPYIADLRFLGKVNNRSRNMYYDEQLNIAGLGKKVQQLINDHIYATGVDPKISPINLLAPNFREHVSQTKSKKAQASEVEHAIRSHISVHVDEDPAYYKKLSERLREIVKSQEEHWGQLVQMLLDFRDNIESERKQGAEDLGLTETEFAFHNLLHDEVCRLSGGDSLDEDVHREVLGVVRELVSMMDEAAGIVDFFRKPDEIRSVKRNIKRKLIETSFGDDKKLRKAVIDSFMDLAKVRLRGNG